MFCPRCATQNVDDAKFCRACGADISLVPQALTGHLAEQLAVDDGSESAGHSRRRHKRGETPTLDNAMRNIFMGVAFLIISAVICFFVRGGMSWGFWMLIPAFTLGGKGVGQFLAANRDKQRLAPPYASPAQSMPPVARLNELPPRNTSEFLRPPASVTEGTTRHLNATPSARPVNAANERSQED